MMVNVSVMLVSSGRLVCMNGWLVCVNMNGSMGRMYGFRIVSMLLR